MNTSKDEFNRGGGGSPPSVGLTSCVLPEVYPPHGEMNSHTGVSTRIAPNSTEHHTSDNHRTRAGVAKDATPPPEHWYALRTTYGQERKAYDYITTHGGKAFLPTILAERTIGGQKKLVEVSRIPNIFFAYGTEEAIKAFVYDNYNLPFLRFYYKHTHVGARIEKTPLIVPDHQIRSLQIICAPNASHILVLSGEEKKFKTGQRVRVVEGDFKGVEGVVARFKGQQRVGIVINGLLTAVTAYIPNAFLEEINE